MNRITIDPITRLEGHGKIEIFLDEEGNVVSPLPQRRHDDLDDVETIEQVLAEGALFDHFP